MIVRVLGSLALLAAAVLALARVIDDHGTTNWIAWALATGFFGLFLTSVAPWTDRRVP